MSEAVNCIRWEAQASSGGAGGGVLNCFPLQSLLRTAASLKLSVVLGTV